MEDERYTRMLTEQVDRLNIKVDTLQAQMMQAKGEMMLLQKILIGLTVAIFGVANPAAQVLIKDAVGLPTQADAPTTRPPE